MTKSFSSQAHLLRQQHDEWSRAYLRQMVSAVPSVEDVRDAFAADEIDVGQLEELMAAAVEERRVELPWQMLVRSRRPRARGRS